jgi:molybdopterin-guanine dinucleotide biosynthesis protein A
MGTDKALLPVGGRPIIERIVEVLGGIFPNLLIVTTAPAHHAFVGVRMVADLMPGCGALGGLHAALFHAPTPHAFVVACDMPFLNPAVIELVAAKARGWDVVVPRLMENLEPLHAVYSRRCLGPIEALLREGGRRIIDLYPRVRVREVSEEAIRALDPELLSFRNVNTPEELRAIEEIAAPVSPQP